MRRARRIGAALLGASLLALSTPALAGPGQARMNDGGGSGSVSNDVPPPASASPASASDDKDSPVRQMVDGVSDVNEVTKLTFQATGAIGEVNGLVDKDMARQANGFFEHKGDILEKAGHALTAYEVRQKAIAGDRRGAAKQGLAAVVDYAIDKGVDAAITAGCAYIAAPTAETAFLPCETAGMAAKFAAEKYIDHKLDGSLGEWTANKAEQGFDALSAWYRQRKDEQDQQAQAQQSQFDALQSSNEQQAIAMAQAQAEAQQRAADAADSQASINFLMQGLNNLAQAQNQPVPYAAPAPASPLAPAAHTPASPAPVAAMPTPASGVPGGPSDPLGPCHAGHNESAHPGGCHKAPITGSAR